MKLNKTIKLLRLIIGEKMSKMEPMGFEFATGEQAHSGLLYPPEADRDFSSRNSKYSLPAPLLKNFSRFLAET